MKIITSLDEIDMISHKTGVALGAFDSIHIGHQTLITSLVDICNSKGYKSVVYTFSNHPRSMTSQIGAPKKILSDEKKLQLLRELGVDYTIMVPFDTYHMTLEPESFICSILKDKLNVEHVVVGFDYRFGYKAKGNVELLGQYQNKYSYILTVIEPVQIQNEIISSTAVRQLISEGSIGKANLYLGRVFSLMGIVIKGKGLGKKLGFPTANIDIEVDALLPKAGVYFTKSIIEDHIFYSITNVGSNPTFGENAISIENHLLNFSDDLYGKKIEVLFFQKLRDEMKFDSIDDLVNQVIMDIQRAKNFFNLE
ncbi:MAG: bifunctional riboflavin kinase/FAD synthetase [Bacillota bacterium]